MSPEEIKKPNPSLGMVIQEQARRYKDATGNEVSEEEVQRLLENFRGNLESGIGDLGGIKKAAKVFDTMRYYLYMLRDGSSPMAAMDIELAQRIAKGLGKNLGEMFTDPGSEECKHFTLDV
ncbi:MAG: hypothetical protein UT24_C0009G0112 [Candidatus Woesebacteria bacterium GW2011_GWB1_39_12]|uniref:Uncharacterized protein n=2 Tax=Candidatus Woeseibacteriota TaxID=1752722 RepID=A0A0G0ME82_9BACT|nr:MAG: hypothetical protein UT23_C0002G0110 [Candidatus Woesebacteria bacterium GW2011_GWA1_39_12]KKR00795.1 MAG: hypothetical protein UT24_C0009G0112 [Candidatus Woesebacteria bacterium GW2011_GWB1_39_12]